MQKKTPPPPPAPDSNFRQIVRDAEAPVVYTLTLLAAMVGMLVYGATKINSGGRGGLFDQLKPIFGVPYGVGVLGLLIAVLAVNRRWKGLVIVGVVCVLYLFLSLGGGARRPFDVSEYLALSASLSCLVTTCLVHYNLLD
jgi:hypothetical protein